MDADLQSRKDYIEYWQRQLENATRAKDYAERQLAKIAIDHNMEHEID